MPSYYAHFQFGKDIVRTMPHEIKSIINEDLDSIDSFIVGLQGPDTLYFHNPLLYTALNREAGQIHHSSGLDFFIPACNYLKKNGTSQGFSYILGCIAHYVLDSSCHPIIIEHQNKEGISHRKVEQEFDDFVLRMNKTKHTNVDFNLILPLNDSLGEICSPFYKTADSKLFNASIKDMRNTLSRLNSKSVIFRYAEYFLLSLIPPIKTVRDMIPIEKSDDKLPKEYFHRNEIIYSEFRNAVPKAIDLMKEALEYIEEGGNLSSRFIPDYLGKI